MFVDYWEGLVLSLLEWGRIEEVENLIYIFKRGCWLVCWVVMVRILVLRGFSIGSSIFYLEQMLLFTPTLQGSLLSNFIGANQDHSAFRIVIYSDCNSSIFEAVIVVAVFAFMQITELSV